MNAAQLDLFAPPPEVVPVGVVYDLGDDGVVSRERGWVVSRRPRVAPWLVAVYRGFVGHAEVTGVVMMAPVKHLRVECAAVKVCVHPSADTLAGLTWEQARARLAAEVEAVRALALGVAS